MTDRGRRHAVATTTGLVTPVLRAVEHMPISVLAAATRDFAERARAGLLHQQELGGRVLDGDQSRHVRNRGVRGDHQSTAVIDPGRRRSTSGASRDKERQGSTPVGYPRHRFGRPPPYRRRDRCPLDACSSRGPRAADPTSRLESVRTTARLGDSCVLLGPETGCGEMLASNE